jgi:hypothetical protein
MADQLDAFLKGDATDGSITREQPPQEAPQADAAPERTPDAPAERAPPKAAPEPAAKAKEAKAEPEAEPEDEALAHVQGGDNRTVPFAALEKVRNDWKSKAAAAEAQAAELRRQLEEAKRPPPVQQAPQPQQMEPPPDFNSNPQGYLQHLVARNQQQMLNERLNMSEAMLRDKIGGEAVDTYISDFKSHAEQDPSLWGKLYAQATPYQWLTGEIDRRRMHAEIGEDPAAYRARIAAEERVKWEAEWQGNGGSAAPRVSPAAGQPPSLANARSVAGRATSTWTGPPTMEDILRRPDKRQSR